VLLPPDIGLAASAWFDLPLAEALANVAGVAGRGEVYSDYNHSLTSAADRRAARQSGPRLTVCGAKA
jgi:hypothetical protein